MPCTSALAVCDADMSLRTDVHTAGAVTGGFSLERVICSRTCVALLPLAEPSCFPAYYAFVAATGCTPGGLTRCISNPRKATTTPSRSLLCSLFSAMHRAQPAPWLLSGRGAAGVRYPHRRAHVQRQRRRGRRQGADTRDARHDDRRPRRPNRHELLLRRWRRRRSAPLPVGDHHHGGDPPLSPPPVPGHAPAAGGGAHAACMLWNERTTLAANSPRRSADL